MRFLYSLGILFFGFLIRVASLGNTKAEEWIKGRKNWQEKLENHSNLKGCIWFHCASLGEFEQGRPLIEKLKKRNPNRPVLLTFYSPSGYEIRKDYPLADCVCYLPLDTIKNARVFLNLTKPDVAIFVKYEVWHNFFAEISARKIPLFMISAIFRETQIYFKPYGSWFRKSLKSSNKIFTQDDKSSRLLNSIGVKQNAVAGDTRFDRVIEVAENAKSIPVLQDFCANAVTLVAGSTWPADEELLMKYHQKNRNLKFIIAPHEIGASHINTLLSKFPRGVKWSKNEEINLNINVIIVDSIGLLSTIYKYGNIAYIGGGFGSGIHNTLEPAVYGIPVIFGPNFNKFKEAKGLCASNGARSIGNYKELESILDDLLLEAETRLKMGKNAGEYVRLNSGATQIILEELNKILL